MRALRTTIALLFVVGAAAFAAPDLGSEVGDAQGILEARVASLEATDKPTKAEKKERRRLVSAGKKLVKYAGEDTAKSLKKAALAVKFIAKSKSTQEDVQGCIDGLFGGLEAVATQARDDALAYTWPAKKSCRDKFNSAVSRGDFLVGRSGSRRHDNPWKASKDMVVATDSFWKAKRLADDCADLPEPRVYVYLSRIYNDLDRAVTIDDIVFSFVGTLGGEPLDFSGRGAQQLPSTFPITVRAHLSYDLTGIGLALLRSDPSLPRWQIGDFFSSDLTLETSEGDFVMGY